MRKVYSTELSYEYIILNDNIQYLTVNSLDPDKDGARIMLRQCLIWLNFRPPQRRRNSLLLAAWRMSGPPAAHHRKEAPPFRGHAAPTCAMPAEKGIFVKCDFALTGLSKQRSLAGRFPKWRQARRGPPSRSFETPDGGWRRRGRNETAQRLRPFMTGAAGDREECRRRRSVEPSSDFDLGFGGKHDPIGKSAAAFADDAPVAIMSESMAGGDDVFCFHRFIFEGPPQYSR